MKQVQASMKDILDHHLLGQDVTIQDMVWFHLLIFIFMSMSMLVSLHVSMDGFRNLNGCHLKWSMMQLMHDSMRPKKMLVSDVELMGRVTLSLSRNSLNFI